MTFDPALLGLSAKERQALLSQLAVLLESGIQLPAALQSMSEQIESPKLAKVLGVMASSVQGGQPLSASILSMPRAFPNVVAQIISAGEEAGRLSVMLERLVEMLESESEVRSKVRSALMYPTIMVVVAATVVTFLVTAVVPRFAGLFRGREDTLPLPTKILMATGEFCSAHGLWLFPTVVVGLVAGVVYLRSASGRPYFDAFLLRVPFIRDIYRLGILSRTSRTLGTLMQSGVAILTCLEHTRGVADSPAYEKLWTSVHVEVGNGSTISDAVHESPLLPSTYKQMLNAGETTARLDQVLLKIAGHYTNELQQRVRDLTTIIEPALVVAMGGVVGFIAFSIMLPIFQLSRNV